jgi:beta-lactamase regulating signal transducer with metallopeptidase domain
MTVKTVKPKLSTRASERKTRIAEQSTREAEQNTRKAEQITRESEQKTRLSEQIWMYVIHTILILLLIFIPIIGVGTLVIMRNLFVNKTEEHREIMNDIDKINSSIISKLSEISKQVSNTSNGKQP